MSLPVYLNRLCLQCISLTSTPPTLAARILAIMHSAMYDAWCMYHSRNQPYILSITLRRPEEEHTDNHRNAAIIYAAYRVLHAYFYLPLLADDNEWLLKDALNDLDSEYKDFVLDPKTPEGLGNLAAQALMDHSFGDGSNVWNTLGGTSPYEDYTAYIPSIAHDETPTEDTIRYWQPLIVPQKGKKEGIIQQFLTPHWGTLRPFAINHGAQFRPHMGPPTYGKYIKQFCFSLVEISEQLTDEHKAIAEYWQDGPDSVTPPGHWCLFAGWVSDRDNHNTGRDIRLFFALANALFDASIAAWEAKRYFDYVRPVTAIRHLLKDETIRAWGGHEYGGVRTMRGEYWHPYQSKYSISPPFAEYPSGHSTFSSAGAVILEKFTGTSYFGYQTVFPAKSSNIEIDAPSFDVTLKWDTFIEAAQEAGMSRLYGGIHFPQANYDGLDMGEKVANVVWDKCNQLWRGTF